MDFLQILTEADTHLCQLTDSEKTAWLDEKIANCGQYGQAGELIKRLLSDWRDYLIFLSDPEASQDEIAQKWPWAISWTGEGLPPYILNGLLNVNV